MNFITRILNFFYTSKQGFFKIALELLNHFFVKVYFALTAVLNLLIWAITIFIYSKIDLGQIVLHYNVDFGVNLYGDVEKIFIIPIVGLSILIVNLLIAGNLVHKEKFIAQLLLVSAFFVNIILLISVGALYLINFR